MTIKAISWILDFTAKLPEEEQVKCLQANDVDAIKIILKACFDPNIEFLLPEGEPPYTPTDLDDQENMLYRESRKLHHFIRGGNDNLPQIKREKMFIDLLESVTPEDAKLLVSIKDKKLPYSISPSTVLKAYPGLF